MNLEKRVKSSFTVIGIEGSTEQGDGFIGRLWNEANSRFGEIESLAKRDSVGNIEGIWGAMSGFSRDFEPWEDFSRGLYLAGCECEDGAVPPAGWTKWVIPGYEYLRAECDGGDTFNEVIRYMEGQEISLAGAVHDFTDPVTGKNYMYFPIRRL